MCISKDDSQTYYKKNGRCGNNIENFLFVKIVFLEAHSITLHDLEHILKIMMLNFLTCSVCLWKDLDVQCMESTEHSLAHRTQLMLVIVFPIYQ